MIRTPTILAGLAAALLLIALGLVWHTLDSSGAVPTGKAAIGTPFRLTDADGVARSDRDFRGHWVLLYFGYTSCPDVCPTTLQEMSDALHDLGGKAHGIVPLFITLDPERDRPATLKHYLASFGPEFVGLTGTLPQIRAVAQGYRVYFAKHPLPGGAYGIDHASTIYLLAPDGSFVTVLDTERGASALAKDIDAHLAGESTG